MVKKHLKRLSMPKSWPLPRKTSKRVVRPLPGAHSFERGMPLAIILKDLLRYAETTRDVKNILKNKNILVEGKKAKEYKQIVGLMDLIEIPETGESFRILIGARGKLRIAPAGKNEAGMKLCKITGKKMHKGKVQLALHDGRTILTDAKTYNTGDSILLKVPEQQIKQHVKMEKNASVFLTGGSHIGQIGNVENIAEDKITFKSNKGTFETPKKFAFVIGKDKPLIQVE